MKKAILKAVKSIVKNTVLRSANTTSSFISHQPTPPKGIEKFKK